MRLYLYETVLDTTSDDADICTDCGCSSCNLDLEFSSESSKSFKLRHLCLKQRKRR